MTQRAKDDLDALFPDNSTRLITPTRLRDLVESCKPSVGELTFAAPGTVTPIANADEFTKAVGATALQYGYRFSMPADNRLRYDGPADGQLALVRAAVSLRVEVTDDQVVELGVAVNGVVDAATVVRAHVPLAGKSMNLAIVASALLDANDYVELHVANVSTAADITIERGTMQVAAFLT